MLLFNGQTANGASTSYTQPGGRVAILVWGTFGGGTVALEVQAHDGTWVPTGDSLTAAGVIEKTLPPCTLRLNLSGATSPSLSAEVK